MIRRTPRPFRDGKDHFEVQAPIRTHWRLATCAEITCPDYVNGWRTVVPKGSDAELMIRYEVRQRYVERSAGEGLVAFDFYPGQPCFKASRHRIKTDRDPLLKLNRQPQEVNQWLDGVHYALDPNITEV